MDNRGVNIDIVFRNGLKDYEVLPPSEAWDKIKPVIQKRQRPLIIFRAAAIIAVALSLSFLAYRWSKEFSAGQEENVQAQNTESATPFSSFDEVSPGAVESRGSPVLLSDASFPASHSDIIYPSENDLIVQNIENLSVSDVLPSREPSLSGNSENSLISNPVITSLETGKSDLPLEPGNITLSKPGRWSISALISPSYHNRMSEGNNEIMAQMMASEQPIISYSGGVALAYRINKRFSVQSGLYFSSIGQELSGISSYSGFGKFNNTKSDFSLITASGTIYTDNTDIFLNDNGSLKNESFDPVKEGLPFIDNSLRQTFNYLEMPVVVRYKVVDKTLDFNIIGGFSSNVLVSNNVSAGSSGNKTNIGGTDGLNKLTFSSSLGMGMEYNLSRNLSLNLEPTVRYYLNPFGAIPGMNIHPYSFGVFSGLSYRF